MELQSNQPTEVSRFVLQFIYDNRKYVTTMNLKAMDAVFTQTMSALIHQKSVALAPNTMNSIEIKLNAAHVENERLKCQIQQQPNKDRKRQYSKDTEKFKGAGGNGKGGVNPFKKL